MALQDALFVRTQRHGHWTNARGAADHAGLQEDRPQVVTQPRPLQPEAPTKLELLTNLVGCPSALSVEVLPAAKWWDRAISAVQKAKSSVDVASLMYDHPRLHSALLAFLDGTMRCRVRLWVDEEAFRTKACYYERSRLAALRAKGAVVHLCKGPGVNGCYHKKVIVIDRRVAFTGSANMTNKSEKNAELVFIMKGPPVMQIMESLAEDTIEADEWDGK